MHIFKNSFDNINEEQIEVLKEYFHGFDYRGAGYTFIANYIWRETHCICWEIIEGYLFMAGGDCMIHDPSAIISMPLTKNGKYELQSLKRGILEAKRRFDERKIPFAIELVPEHMVHLLSNAFSEEIRIEHDRDQDEYVYLKDKLITLSGRALHKKKNHMNYFLKTYQYDTCRITMDMEEEVLDLVRRCRLNRDYTADELESLRMEEEAIRQLLQFVEESAVFSTAVYIDGTLEAFALGERLNEDTAVEHFEKANDSYRGLYQIICSEFCKSLPDNIIYVNREEDMGLENLRKAKEALRPDHMEQRYSVDFCKIK